MSAQSNVAPVIIKRKKVSGGGGHHGGAWKVAYADFVTAMMAFFMLMWLLNATTEKQRKGIADYFSPTIPINRVSGGGNGAFGGDSVFTEQTLARNGQGASALNPTQDREASGAEGRGDSGETAALKEIETALLGRGGESFVSRELLRHVVTRVTDEGLVIELFDQPGAQLFDAEADAPTALLRDLVEMISGVTGLVENGIAVATHSAARAVVRQDAQVWDLTLNRAGAVRGLLEAAGTGPARLRRATGHADRRPIAPDRMALRNNRIEITLLRSGRE